MVMVIFGSWKASSELRFASKLPLTSDFEVLEASGAPKSDQESPKKLPRSPLEAPKRLLGGVLGALGGPKSSPSHDPRYIHRFQSLQEASRRSPSHDLSALPTFSSLQKGDKGVKLSVEPGPAGPPDTLAHVYRYLNHWKFNSLDINLNALLPPRRRVGGFVYRCSQFRRDEKRGDSPYTTLVDRSFR